MDLRISQDLCIGCGVCADVAPELIEMNDEQLAVMIVDSVGEDMLETAKAAIECCPVDAVYEGSEEEE